jgi:hypothetical protein
MRAMNREKPKPSSGIFRWVDTPWVIAAVLGIWGVMIGSEEFLLANLVACIAAILAAVQLARETLIWTRRRHTLPFVFGLLAVIALVGSAFWWTGRQKSTSEAKSTQLSKLSQIPQLQKTIQNMTKSEQNAAQTQAVEQGKLEQKVSDIGADNKSLKTSIEKKDAVLAQIAHDQYALNFAPQIAVMTSDFKDQVAFVNQGKTNVMLSDVNCAQTYFYIGGIRKVPAQITPNSNMGITLIADRLKDIVLIAPHYPDGEVPVECTASIETLDKKHYLLPFTWFFVVKDNSISRCFAVPRAVTEVKE